MIYSGFNIYFNEYLLTVNLNRYSTNAITGMCENSRTSFLRKTRHSIKKKTVKVLSYIFV